MQHLRIMGVTEEDSEDLLVLADDSGQEYALPVDGALRATVGRRSTRPAHLTTRAEDPRAPMTVREVQARLRAGASVERMVADSGLDPARVERYAGPVQAERAYYAQQARNSQVAPPSSAEQHRLAFGDSPATLEAMVKVRLRSVGVDLDSLAWDAWRRQDGSWQVMCWFHVSEKESVKAGIDTEPPAEWIFSPESRHVRPVDPWAEALSTLPAAPGGRRGPRRLAVVDDPFDVESGAPETPSTGSSGRPQLRQATPAPLTADEQDTSPIGAGSPASSGLSRPSGPADDGDEHEDLLDVLRARRGQRLGADEEADDKLALMLTREDQPADHSSPHLRAVQAGAGDDPEAPAEPAEDNSEEKHDPSEAPARESSTDAWGFSYADAEDASSAQVRGSASTPQTDKAQPADADEPGERSWRRSQPKKPSSRRPNMPRWDDILFGSKDD